MVRQETAHVTNCAAGPYNIKAHTHLREGEARSSTDCLFMRRLLRRSEQDRLTEQRTRRRLKARKGRTSTRMNDLGGSKPTVNEHKLNFLKLNQILDLV